MLSISRFNRFLSSGLLIFCESEIRLENGTKTRYLPANDNSDDIRGPLVEIGSLAI